MEKSNVDIKALNEKIQKESAFIDLLNLDAVIIWLKLSESEERIFLAALSSETMFA